MRPGDLVLIFFVWYAAVRFALESLRTGNWTFFGVPTAMVVSAAVIVVSLATLAYRHRPGAVFERWGDPPVLNEDDEEWLEEDEVDEDHDRDGGAAGAEDGGGGDDEDAGRAGDDAGAEVDDDG